MKRITKSIASSTAALLCLAGCAGANKAAIPAPAPQAQAAEVKEAVQFVNGVAITRADVERASRVILSQGGSHQKNSQEKMKQAAQTALDQLTTAELLYQEAAKIEIKDLDQQVEKKIAETKALYPSPAAFEQALKGSGLTVEEMTRNTRKTIAINTFIEERFASKTEVSDADTQKFYQEGLDKYFTKPESARASHILVKTDEKMTPEEKQKAREKAEALLKRVKGGEDFAAVAKAESGCPSATVGGDLGSFGRGQMVPSFEKAVFDMKPGEISSVVESQFGFHIIKLVEKHEAGKVSYDEAKAKIVEYLKAEKVRQAVMSFVDELKSKAKITRV
ncbi:peptidylprolyl isomerase [Geomonas anaerohicana]|uniref:peptidylprolyl isomerase n=1 Tax=Geomonas anaerohicana TaxID=2798583 RepID=A0ABS0YH04_9BACT|nr:peptidylprolyl isomerase [Geomonas anaerohicana]MBJ6751537.1 peptidylprolyl isomerase [Geomonas anaerohicana]